MSPARLINIQGTDHSLSTNNIASDTSVYIVNRLAAKAGAAYSGYKLHYLTEGIWLKCNHDSPLKKYQGYELEFRLPNKPSVFVKKPKVVETVYKKTPDRNGIFRYRMWTPIEITHELDDKTSFKRYYRLGSKSLDDVSSTATSDIEKTGAMDQEDKEKEEAVKVRNLYISAQKASNGKRKEVKSVRQGLRLSQSDIEDLLDGEDYY